MKRARSRTPSPLPALQPLSFSPLRENSRSPTPLQRQCKWMRNGTRRCDSHNHSKSDKVVQNEDKELMLALQRLHDKLQVSEPAYQDEDVAIITFPSENNSLSRSPHRTSESEDAFFNKDVDDSNSFYSSSNNANNGVNSIKNDGGKNNSPSKRFVANQVYECTETGNVSTTEHQTRSEKLYNSTLQSTRRNVNNNNYNKVSNVCNVTSSLLLTSVNLLDASQITRHRRSATNALNMIKKAYALVTAECTQTESTKCKKTIVKEEEENGNTDNIKVHECLQSNRMMCSTEEEMEEKENKRICLPLCHHSESVYNNSYISWLVCKLHACVQSLLVYANASLPLRFAISSDKSVLLMLCDIGTHALECTSQHYNCNSNSVNRSTSARNVHVELESLREHWQECGLSSRLLHYLEQAYVLEFLLDAALPPAVCSTRYDGMHTALLSTKQKIISEFATSRNTNNLLPSVNINNNTENSDSTNRSIKAVSISNTNNNNNRTVSVSLTRVCNCFPLRALCALITMSSFADVKVRVRLLDKLTSEGLLERILQEMHKATHELHILIVEEEKRLTSYQAQHTEHQVHNDGKENIALSKRVSITLQPVERKNWKSNETALESQSHCSTTLSVDLARPPLCQINEPLGNCIDVLLLLSCANLRPACEADELASNAKTASMAVIRPSEWLMHMTEIKGIVQSLMHVLTFYCSLPLILKSSGSSLISQIVECLHQMLNVNECIANIVEEEIGKLITSLEEHDIHYIIDDNNKIKEETREVKVTNSFALLSVLLPIISQIIMLRTSTSRADCISCNDDWYTRHTKWFTTLSYYLPFEYEVERELTRTRHSTVHWGMQLQKTTATANETLEKSSNKCITVTAYLNGTREESWWELHVRNNELHKCTRRLSRRELCVMNDFFDFAHHVVPGMQSQLEQQLEYCEEYYTKNVCMNNTDKNNKAKEEQEELIIASRESIRYRVQCVYVFCSKVAAIASVVLATAHRRQNNLFFAKAVNCLYVLSPILERMKKQMSEWENTIEATVSAFVCTPYKAGIANTSCTAAKLSTGTSDSKTNKVYTPERMLASRTSETSTCCTTSEKESNENRSSASLSPFITSPATSLHFEAALSRSNSEETVGDVLGLQDNEHRTPHSTQSNDKSSVVNNVKLYNCENNVEDEQAEEEEEEEEISPQTVTRSWRERFSFHSLFMTRLSATLTPTQTSTSCSSNCNKNTK